MILSGDYRDSYLYKASLIENMPGIPRVSGAELLDRLYAHAVEMGANMIKGQATLALQSELYDATQTQVPGFQIAYGASILQARTIILSTGASSGAVFPGEKEFLGRGVSYCATCDGMLYRGKKVAVIAQSKDALEEALHLSKIGCSVSLFIRSADVKRWEIEIPDAPFDQIIYATKYEILGTENISALRADAEEYPVDGVFILRSTLSPTTLLSELSISSHFIQTDKKMQTNIPGVFAAGDCAVRKLADGTALRLESVQNATEQGKSAAAALLGQERPFTATAWFWSDQYDKKLQMAGLSMGADTWAVRGDMASGPFSVYHFKGEQLLAVDSVNATKDHLQARKLLDLGVSPTPAQVKDLGFDLANLLQQ